jgi:hypothetical protein
MTEHDQRPAPTEGAPASEAPFEMSPTEPEAPRRRPPQAYAAVAIGLLGMVAGAVFFARSLTGAGTGASSPDEAVRRLFAAASNEDVLGVLEALVPAEREAFGDSLVGIARELGRLGVLRADLDLSDVPGIDLEFTGLRFSTKDLAPGIAAVAVVEGTARTRVDPAAAPLGDVVRRRLPVEELRPSEETEDLSGGEVEMVAVREGGGWYVSLWYSLAEGMRREAAAPLPPFGHGVAARGAATPERAVEDLLRAAAGVDLRRLIELMPPDEARALHDYAPLFLPSAEAGAAEARRELQGEIRALDLEAKVSGSTALVTVRSISFGARIPGLGMAVDYDGRCVSVQGPSGDVVRPERVCDRGVGAVAQLPGLRAPGLGFVAVQRDGLWYVSPTRTVAGGLLAILRALDPDALDAAIREFESLLGSTEESFSTSFSSRGVPAPPVPTPLVPVPQATS